MPMTGPARLARMPTARTLAQVYRHFGEVDAAGRSPLHQRVAVAVSESGDALHAIEAAPARHRGPAVILAALHDLALAGHAPALAAAYAAGDGDAAAGAAVGALLAMTDAVLAAAARWPVRAGETGRCAVLYPAIAEAAHRAGADTVGLIDVGCSAGLSLSVDRVSITYSSGPSLGDPSSPVQQSCRIAGGNPVPARGMPEVTARIGVDLEPADVTDPEAARWLRACLAPEEHDRAARLDAEMAVLVAGPRAGVGGRLLAVRLLAIWCGETGLAVYPAAADPADRALPAQPAQPERIARPAARYVPERPRRRRTP
jgi:hypothetical protein